MPTVGLITKKPAAKEPASQVKACLGTDTEGSKYNNVGDMWSAELEDRKGWYTVAESYWQGQAASIDGVLGGFPETHGPDLRDSKHFLDLLHSDGALRSRGSKKGLSCLDCGAGIGRVTKGLLLDTFDLVDLVEPNKRLLDMAQKELRGDSRAGKFIASPLQSLEIPASSYDVIWAQWVLLYLPDDDLIAFFNRCKRGLRREGLICVKENIVLKGKWLVDKEDNSISRTDAQMKAIFEKCDLEVVREMRQKGWPARLIPVMMYALRPRGAAPRTVSVPAVKRRPVSAKETLSAKRRRG